MNKRVEVKKAYLGIKRVETIQDNREILIKYETVDTTRFKDTKGVVDKMISFRLERTDGTFGELFQARLKDNTFRFQGSVITL